MRARSLAVSLLAIVVLSVLNLAPASAAGPDETLVDLTERLQADIDALRKLSNSIESAPERDRDALIYRRDDRSFRLLNDIQQLVEATVDLPENDPQRQAVVDALKGNLQGAGEGILQRITDLGDRIAALQAEVDQQGGSQLVTAEAFIQSLESLRFNYYESLVEVINGRKALGLSDGNLREALLPILYLQGEAMIGRVEYTGRALGELRDRISLEPDNADVSAAVSELSRQQTQDLARLEIMIGLLNKLGEDPIAYRAVLLEQGNGLSIASFETGAVVSLLEDSWQAVQESVTENAPDFVFNLVVFILILVIFRALSRLTRNAVKSACERPGVDMSTLLKDVLVSVCGSTVMVIGILVALAQVGISLGPMLAGLGVAGFVIGFALQDTLGNFAAGGMILIYRPYDVDDFVEVAGASGLVKKMSLVSTTITTFDNQTLVVPNSKIWGDVIKNVTAQKLRRVDLVFGIGYSDDIPKAEKILGEVVAAHEKTLSKPEALIKLHELGDSSVNFVVRPWVKTEDYWDVYWDLTREVKLRFDLEGVSIPFPQRDVHIYQESADTQS